MATVTFSACSGGGGGNAAGGGAPPSTSPTTSAPPTPTPTASPTPQPVFASGSIVDFDSKARLSNIVVYVSHTLVPSDTAPAIAPSDGGRAVTAANGSYSMILPAQSSYPARFYIEAFGPNGMSTAHEILTVSAAGTQTVPTIGLTTLSTDEAGWLVLVNQDRAKWSAPPVVSDETSQEVARLWVAWLGQDHFEHSCAATDVNCPNKTAYEGSENADFNASGENIAEGQANYEDAEAGFMAEQSNCPQPTNPSTCPFSEDTGHFLNIVNTTVLWYGSAEDLDASVPQGTARDTTYDQEFNVDNIAGNTINARIRTLKTYRTVVPVP